MSDTDAYLLSENHQQQQTPKERQFTLSKSDLAQLTAAQLFDEQEALFIESLNVDNEVQQAQMTEEQTEVDTKKEINLDDLKQYVNKCVSRQDISPSFAAMESDFFEKVKLCVHEMTPDSNTRMEQFIYTRLERIIMYSKSFSTNIGNLLTREERELYTELCDAVSRYREKIDKIMKGNK